MESDISERMFFAPLEANEVRMFSKYLINEEKIRFGLDFFETLRKFIIDSYLYNKNIMLPQIKAPIAV